MAPEIRAEDVFNPNDFESIRLVIYFENSTTHSKVKDSSQVSLVEIGDKILTFELPPRSCNLNHNVLVSICKVVPGTKGKEEPLLNLTGKIVALEEHEKTSVRATVEAVQFDDQSWNQLISLYSKRQEEITAFLAATRGE